MSQKRIKSGQILGGEALMDSVDNPFPKGLNLLDALIRNLTPSQRARLAEYGDRANDGHFHLPGDDVYDPWPVSYRWPLERAMMDKLGKGELVATGILIPTDPRQPRQVIPRDLWNLAWADFDKSTLEEVEVWKIVNIEVLLESEYRAWQQQTKLQSSVTRKDRGKENERQESAFQISLNGQLRIGREYLHFRGVRQFSLVKQLLTTTLTGKPVKISTILDDSGFSSSVDTLNKAFKNNPSWPVLKKYLVHQQGFVRLAFEAENENGADASPMAPK
ncbi:MAG: hypothetical protein ABIS49_01900 [Aestuariivirga sp.]